MIEDLRAVAPTHRRWTAAAGTALLVLGVAGCSFSGSVDDATGGSPGSAGTPASTPASTSTSPPTSSSTSTSTGPSTATSSSSGPAPSSSGGPSSEPSSTGPSSSAASSGEASSSTCRTADLAVSAVADPGGGSAGHQHLLVRFTNRGAGACVLDGHPGVSLVAGDDGHQVGAAASREGSPAAVRLAPGATAQAALSVAQAGNYDSGQCGPTAVRGLRVYPPDQTASVFVAVDGLTGCSGTSVVLLVVDPVVAS